jgi:hypothetical protein
VDVIGYEIYGIKEAGIIIKPKIVAINTKGMANMFPSRKYVGNCLK